MGVEQAPRRGEAIGADDGGDGDVSVIKQSRSVARMLGTLLSVIVFGSSNCRSGSGGEETQNAPDDPGLLGPRVKAQSARRTHAERMANEALCSIVTMYSNLQIPFGLK